MTDRVGRVIEDAGFFLAMLLGVGYGCAEAAARIGLTFRCVPPDDHFPWGLLIVVAALVLPKTVGRATAGRIWLAAAEKVEPPEVEK